MVRLLFVGCLMAVVVRTSPPEERKAVETILNKTNDNAQEQQFPNISAPENDAQLHKILTGSEPTTLSPMALYGVDISKMEDRPEFAEYGIFGTNYYTENGRPYVFCASSTKRQQLSTMLKCFPDQQHRHALGCFAVFNYHGLMEMLKYKPIDDLTEANLHLIRDTQGCWSHQVEALETCSRGPVCEIVVDRVNLGEQIFCCCLTHNCNDHGQIVRQLSHLVEKLEEEEEPPVPAEDSSLITGLFIAFACLFAAVVAFLAFWFICMKRYKHDPKRIPGSIVVPEDASLLPRIEPEPYVSGLDSKITYIKMIGKGKYGDVMLGTWKSPSLTMDVAVKIIKDHEESFTNELMIYREPCMRQYEKANILRLLDCEQDSRGTGRLVTEYHPLGNLHNHLVQYIIDKKQDCVNIIVNLLDALAYLHEERGNYRGKYKPAILHRDLKSHNILLKRDEHNRLMGVITDFGLSTKCSQDIINVMQDNKMLCKVVGTQRYMAPELLVGSCEFTTTAFRAVDVYAMALIMWEIVSRTQVSFDDVVPEYEEPLEAYLRREQPAPQQLRLSTFRQVVVSHKRRPEFREKHIQDPVISQIKSSIEEMWEHETEARITAACAHKRMLHLLDEPSIGYHSDTYKDPLGETHLSPPRPGGAEAAEDEGTETASDVCSTASSKSNTLHQEEEDETKEAAAAILSSVSLPPPPPQKSRRNQEFIEMGAR